jgi:hypothetical protein
LSKLTFAPLAGPRCHGNDYGKVLKTNNIVNGNIGGSGSLFLGVFGVSGFIGGVNRSIWRKPQICSVASH